MFLEEYKNICIFLLLEEKKMTEEQLKDTIEELKSELQVKNDEINEYLDKIGHLEDMIMEIEASLTKGQEEKDSSLLNVQLRYLEGRNQELKKKISFIRLENVKLKQELDKIKKGYFDRSTLIQVVESKLTPNQIEPVKNTESKIRKEYIHELFNYVRVKCPKCEKEKSLKIPIKIVNQNLNITTINIPKGMICDHSFQILIDKSFKIKRYQLIDCESHLLEFSKNSDEEDSTEKDEDITHFISFPFYQDVIGVIRESIDEREVLGTAIFTIKGKVIFASIPSNLLFNVIKEFDFRNEKQLLPMTKMYIETDNLQKIFSECIEILNKSVIFVLIFSEKVNFAMGTMIFRDLVKKVNMIIRNYKDEPR